MYDYIVTITFRDGSSIPFPVAARDAHAAEREARDAMADADMGEIVRYDVRRDRPAPATGLEALLACVPALR